jgi:response regulator RpfG family c-di-GMP phosphodiesterase
VRVLIVEDDPDTVALIKNAVGRLSRCSTIVYPEPAALTSSPDLIDFDLALIGSHAHGSGLTLMARQRRVARHAQTPIVILTSAGDRPEIRIDAFEAGATDVMAKPLEFVELRVRLRNLLQLRESQLALADRAASLKAAVMSATDKLKAREREIVLRLCRAVDYHGSDMSDHLGRMAHYCYIIAQELGFPPETCEFLHLAAHMHDIGKIGVSAAILQKPAKLSAEERAEMEQHTLFGEKILEGSSSPLIQLAAIIAASHHEKWDGSGYPRALKGSDIPIAGRIAAVADVFDALTSQRTYKNAWPLEDSRQYLVEQRGRHFDPACVDALLRRWDDVKAICSGERNLVLAA